MFHPALGRLPFHPAPVGKRNPPYVGTVYDPEPDTGSFRMHVGQFYRKFGNNGDLQDINGCGFQPSLVMFYTCQPDDALKNTVSYREGWRTASNNGPVWGAQNAAGEKFLIACGSYDTAASGAPPSITWSYLRDDLCIGQVVNGSVPASGFINNFHSDGFVINWSTNSQFFFNYYAYIAFGGTHFQSKIGTVTLPSATGDLAVTGPGWSPDLIHFAGGPSLLAGFNAATNGARLRLGAADREGNQWAMNYSAENAANPANTERSFLTDCCLNYHQLGAQRYKASWKSMDPTGFTINFSTVNTDAGKFGYVAMKGVLGKVGNFTKPTTQNATQAVPAVAGVKPRGVFLAGVQLPVNAAISDGGNIGMGAASSAEPGHSVSFLHYETDGNASVVVQEAADPAHAYIKADVVTMSYVHPGDTPQAKAKYLEPTFGFFNLKWSPNDPVATQIGFVAYSALAPNVATAVALAPTPTIITTALQGWVQGKLGTGGWQQSIINSSDNGVALICAATGDESTVEQTFAVTPGNMYRLGVRYMSPQYNTAPTETWMEVQVTGSPNFIASDGRSLTADGRLIIAPSADSTRDLVLDFICPVGVTQLTVRFGCTSGSGAAALNVYSATIQPIYCFVPYENRLAGDSVGDTEQGASPWVGDQTLGVGNVSVIISDGVYQLALPQLLMINKRVRMVSGGNFGVDCQEILRNNCRVRFYGYVKDFEADYDRLDLMLEDARLFLKTKLPREQYTFTEYPDIFINRVGYGKPIVAGVADFFPDSSGQSTPWIDPTRIGLVASTKYGIYQYADGAHSPAGLYDAPEIRVYESQDAATFKANSGKIINTSTIDLPNGQFTINDNVKPHSYNGDSKIGRHTLDFDIGGGALGRTGFLSWTANEVAADETAAWGNGITISYDHTTHKFTWTRAGVLNLKPNTGSHAASAADAWTSMGVRPDVDYNTGNPYTSSDPTFVDADKDHIVLVRANGFKDTTTGEYTGVPGGLIKLPADIVRMILQHYVRLPKSQFDLPSFIAARSGEGQNPVFYFQQFIQTVEEILKRFEQTMLSDITVDGDGTIRIVPYKNTYAPVRSFNDSDYITFKAGKKWDHVKPTITLYYGYDPHRDRFASIQRNDPATFARLQIDDPVSIYTWLAYSGAAGSRADDYLKLYTANPDWIQFTARGKMVDLKIGDKILVTASNVFVQGGRLDNAEFRVRYTRFNDTTRIGECHAMRSVEL